MGTVSSFVDRLNRVGLVPRILALVLLGIVMLGASIYVLTAYQLFENAGEAARDRVESNMKVAWDALHQKGASFHAVDGKLFVGDYLVNGNYDLVDKVTQMVGGTCTIFMGDLRVSTNVQKPDGSRAVGTRLAKSAAYEAVLERKTSFRGEVEILGEPYMTAYDPILDDSGAVVGVLYTGVKKSEFTKGAKASLETIAVATLIVMLLGMGGSYLIVRRSIALPLRARRGPRTRIEARMVLTRS